MQEKNGQIELTEEEARMANFYPRFPLGKIPMAIAHMRQRQNELQAAVEEGWEHMGEGQQGPISRHGFALGRLIDELERLR